jgi:hypothetical protein
MDRDLYKANMLKAISEAEDSLPGKLEIVECSVKDLIIEDGVCKGVMADQ